MRAIVNRPSIAGDRSDEPATHALDRRLHQARTSRTGSAGEPARASSTPTTSRAPGGRPRLLGRDRRRGAGAGRPPGWPTCGLGGSIQGVLADVEEVPGPATSTTGGRPRWWPGSTAPRSWSRPGTRRYRAPAAPGPHGAEVLSAQGVLQALDQASSPAGIIARIDAALQGFGPASSRSAPGPHAGRRLPGNRRLAAARAELSLLATRVIGDPLGAVEVLDAAESAIRRAAASASRHAPWTSA